jgi:tetratricopeptide (TPR) repeat protein
MVVRCGDNSTSKDERIAYHIDHVLTLFQNVTRKVAIDALQAILEDGKTFLDNRITLFTEWQILGQVKLLKQQLERNKNRNDAMGNYIAHILEEKIKVQLTKVKNEDTSYDCMTNAMLQRFQFHPYKAKALFKRAIELNCRNFEAIYCQSMISLRLIRVVDYLKCLRVALHSCEQEIHEMKLASHSNNDPDLVWFDEIPIRNACAFRHAISGRIYIKFKQNKRALQEYKTALKHDPKFMFSYFYLGQYYAFDGERNEALARKNFEKALSLVGVQRRTVYTSLIYDNMGQSFEIFSDNRAAMECYEKAIQHNQLYAWGYQGRGYVNGTWNMYDRAIQDSTKCLKFEPEMKVVAAEIYAERARIQFGLDNKEQCILDLETCRRLDPTQVYPYVMLSFLEKDKRRALQLLDEGERNCCSDPTDLQYLLERKAWYYTHVEPNQDMAKLYAQRAKRMK